MFIRQNNSLKIIFKMFTSNVKLKLVIFNKIYSYKKIHQVLLLIFFGIKQSS